MDGVVLGNVFQYVVDRCDRCDRCGIGYDCARVEFNESEEDSYYISITLLSFPSFIIPIVVSVINM